MSLLPLRSGYTLTSCALSISALSPSMHDRLRSLSLITFQNSYSIFDHELKPRSRSQITTLSRTMARKSKAESLVPTNDKKITAFFAQSSAQSLPAATERASSSANQVKLTSTRRVFSTQKSRMESADTCLLQFIRPKSADHPLFLLCLWKASR